MSHAQNFIAINQKKIQIFKKPKMSHPVSKSKYRAKTIYGIQALIAKKQQMQTVTKGKNGGTVKVQQFGRKHTKP